MLSERGLDSRFVLSKLAYLLVGEWGVASSEYADEPCVGFGEVLFEVGAVVVARPQALHVPWSSA